MNIFEAVKNFHEKYDLGINQYPNEELRDLRSDLIREEHDEVLYVLEDYKFYPRAKQSLTEELADLLYVTIGTAVQFGLPLEEVFKRKHEANMTKNGGKREDGKLLKGDGYIPPKLEDLFE